MIEEPCRIDNVSRAVGVACCQLAPVFGDIPGNMRLSRDILTRAAGMGAQVAVLPELVNTGYAFSNRDEARNLAQSAAGACVSEWSELAIQLDLIVVAGFCEADGDKLYNTAALLTPDGRQALYRKAHLWDSEKKIFDSGCQPPPVVETAVGRLGLMICYDLEVPEWVRLPSLEGADLLCVPVNWPVQAQQHEALPIEVIKAQANAAFNRLPVVVCDRAGHERGIDWAGCSLITDANGYKLAFASRPAKTDEIVFAQLDLNASREKHISQHNHVLLDRRPDLYR